MAGDELGAVRISVLLHNLDPLAVRRQQADASALSAEIQRRIFALASHPIGPFPIKKSQRGTGSRLLIGCTTSQLKVSMADSKNVYAERLCHL